MDYRELRQKYPKFIYKSFSTKVLAGKLILKFKYQTPPDLIFTHTLEFSGIGNFEADKNLVFNIGLAEMFSYWKATCSPIVEIQTGFLDPDQIAFWHKLFIRGMGEYYYKNNIDFTPKDFIKITSENKRMTINDKSMAMNDKILIPIGGGKDSIVTGEILKKHFPINCLLVNPTPAMTKIAQMLGCNQAEVVRRRIDPYLLKLNQQNYLNGHIPFSSVLAFISLLYGYKYIAVSNERSSNEGNVTYLGQEINHQYSKSLEFENDFNEYQKTLAPVKYFSFLRPLYENQIIKLFIRYPQYFKVFRSCNQYSKTGQAWCLTCPKCVSSAILLGQKLTRKIMVVYPPQMPENKAIMDGLLGVTPVKPFECVLTRNEALGKIDINSYLSNPNMPEAFDKILRSEL